MVHDVRALANFVLDVAEKERLPLTNMQINKIVYFLHADCLASRGRPLVSAKIEAWEHGPVFRELYQEFKRFGDQPISARATRLDPTSGERHPVVPPELGDDAAFISASARKYAAMSASALRAQSHVPGGPWDKVWNHDTTISATMRITDEAILDWYGRSAKH